MGCSFIELPSDEVVELANACLTRIQNNKDREWDDIIQRELYDFDRSWIRKRIFARPTREGIRRIFEKESGFITCADIVNGYGWKSEDAANRLLLAARYADVVKVSTEDLRLITK
jgi:hypothetical protein